MLIQEGGNLGHKLRLKGTGFPSSLEKYSCQISGGICTVVEASENSISIEIPEISAENTDFGSLPEDQSPITSLINSELNGTVN